MGGMKDLLLDEEIGAKYFEDVPEHKPLSVRENSLLPLIQPSEVIFREKGTGLKELMGNRFPHEKKTSCSLPEEITVITYTVVNAFSADVTELIKRASEKASLRIAFCYQGKNISGIISAFNKLFESRQDLTIQVIVNPHTHIKMLQVDDTLYMGSMNYSSTADSAQNDGLTDEKESFFNHEVLFYFNRGGKRFSENLFNKIRGLTDSIDFEINRSNYRSKLTQYLQERTRTTIGRTRETKLLQQRALDEKNTKSLMELLPALIRSQVSSTVRHILDINAHYRLENEVFSEDEVEKTVRYFQVNDGEVFITDFLALNCPGFIKFSSGDGEEDDDDEDDFNHELTKEFLSGMTDTCTEHLADLVIDDDKLREEVSAERYDPDNGEDDLPWGSISQEKYEERFEENKREVILALSSLIDELTRIIIDEECFDISFFINKSAEQFRGESAATHLPPASETR
ncbi:hypothetical protein HGT73_01300 [Rosenbergiella australiborealis]|uniref:PLD phosphodiesterase domain-containing protein n=1 Tax=Rosenbergiella australiborealis TaxID=1544696 RepID=A0ABS5T1G1_9GAMM|nr:hypothetical protein [Rosenbergiella australiborealis]MBT0726027.1 hypothetical protein [Rosenbergiella australiborealis]